MPDPLGNCLVITEADPERLFSLLQSRLALLQNLRQMMPRQAKRLIHRSSRQGQFRCPCHHHENSQSVIGE